MATKMHAVFYTAADEMTTEHSAWPTYEQAVKAGGDLARRVWAEKFPEEPFPDGTDEEAMEVLRGSLPVQLEVEPIEVHAQESVALLAAVPTTGRAREVR